MPHSLLFSPYDLRELHLPHRIVMCPMTRCRSAQPGNIPTTLMATYYGQRASAALIITEATQISPKGQGYSFTPGIHTDDQEKGWRQITETVHQKGGHIFLQLWHVGRLSHASFHEDRQPIAPSAIEPNARVWIADALGVGHMLDCSPPRAMTQDDINIVIDQFRAGARRAMRAGFDGVEIHGANGYLIDQFLRTTSNKRTDQYGGSIENRIRFPLEVVEAVCDEVGASRTGIRLSPHIRQRGMDCPEIIEATLSLVTRLNKLNPAYIHLVEADWDDAPFLQEQFRRDLRTSFNGTLIAAGGYTLEKATSMIQNKLIDLAAFGRPFIANPDLPLRLEKGWPLASFDPKKLYGGGEAGYTDYPFYNAP